MGSDDLIDFDVIENQKENIQALPSGRSARALAQLFTPPLSSSTTKTPTPSNTQDSNNTIRQEFEKELLAIDDSDDPLDIYDRYVKWTLDAYPSAQNTPQSQLCTLLERATKAFQSSTHYKNDPRYLKLWLHYIRFFSDTPRETFAYLARHNIGDGLALFYEEFAAWLETAGRWTQAEEVYQMGIDREARPMERLIRKFGEFQHRFENRPENTAEPTSPALPTVRPALAAKVDPFSHAAATPPPNPQARPAGGASKRAKLSIFSDGDDAPKAGSSSGTKGWDTIGTLADRRKENTPEAKPWAGQTLKVGKKNTGVSKMMIFKDETTSKSQNEQSNPHPMHDHQQSVNPRTGKVEVVFVDLQAVYPNYDDPMAAEFSFEELRAKRRGYLDYNWAAHRKEEGKKAKKETKTIPLRDHAESENTTPVQHDSIREPMKARSTPIEANLVLNNENVIPIHHDENSTPDPNDENAVPSQAQIDKAKLAKKARREERANRTRKIKVMEVREIRAETQTVQTNLDSPIARKVKRKKGGSAEPTMTLHTKEAMDEIYDIFNQPLKNPGEEEPAEESDSGDDVSDDDYTSAAESTGTGRISCSASEFGDETTAADFTLRTTVDEDEEEDEDGDDGDEADDTDVKSVSEWSDFTEIKHVPKSERNENLDGAADDDTEHTYEHSFEDTSVSRQLDDEHQADDDHRDDLVTPTSPYGAPAALPTRFVPIPPEDWEVPTRPYRDPIQAANNRLPFMTPIVEKTESSIGMGTIRSQKDYFTVKTPSRSKGALAIHEDDGKIAQPALLESQKPKEQSAVLKAQPLSKKATEVKEPVLKGPIIKDAQCNPVDEGIRETILNQIQPPLSSYEGYSADLSKTAARGAEIRKFTKAVKTNKTGDKTATNLAMPPTLKFDASQRQYVIKRELGKGAFAPVYLVESTSTEEEDDDQPPQMGKGEFGLKRKRLEAVKMEDPPSAWEFYIMRQAKRRLGVSRATDSIVHAYEMHLFKDEGFLVEEFRDQGTLLDLVNIARAEGGSGVMDEQMAMFFTVELFRTVESLHSKGLIHGDLKADNVLVRFDAPPQEDHWSTQYQREGRDGWAAKGISLIDFGRGIDMKVFKPDVQFIADWKTTEADCAEMREMRPWTFQIDYHGLAGIVHNLLFGKYIDTVAERGATLGAGATKTYRIRESLKRYWQTDIWKEVLDLLLNPLMHLEGEEGNKMPVLKGMKAVRERMETYLEENCEKGIGLKALIRRMEDAVKRR